jgi:hypothetical protein
MNVSSLELTVMNKREIDRDLSNNSSGLVLIVLKYVVSFPQCCTDSVLRKVVCWFPKPTHDSRLLTD